MADRNHPKPASATTSWFHVFRAMFESGQAKEMGKSAFMVYCAIKAHVHYKQGVTFPSLDKISEETGMSRTTTVKALGVLEKMGFVRVERTNGRPNVYTLREQIPITNEDGSQAVASWDYIPSAVKKAQAELKEFLVSGNQGEPQIIHIQQLVLQMNFAPDNAVNINQAQESEKPVEVLIKKSGGDSRLAELARSAVRKNRKAREGGNA